MAEPKVGMKFSSFNEVLKNAQKRNQVQKMKMDTRNGRLFTSIYLKTGSYLAMNEPAKDSRETTTNIEYNTDSLSYRGNGEYTGRYTRFSEIHGTNTYAKDLNGNGIVDKGEIFKL